MTDVPPSKYGNACLTHCCPIHGCKYGYGQAGWHPEKECQVVSGLRSPEFPNNNGCERCEADADEPPTAFEEYLAWQLALTANLSPNPRWNDWFGSMSRFPRDKSQRLDSPGVVLATLRLHNGTALGEVLTADGSTTNEAFQGIKTQLLKRKDNPWNS